MQRKHLVIGTIVAGVGITLGVLCVAQKNILFAKGLSEYQIQLNSNNSIYSSSSFNNEGPVSGVIRTGLNNEITLDAYNVVSYNNGWQTLLPNGYFYNPINNSNYKNKINGIESIVFEGNGSLKLHYGYTINNNQVVYSTEETISPNVELFLQDSPSYFYIKNDNSFNVNIDSLRIKYSCSESAYPRNNLNVLMIGNSFADDTVFYARRVAEAYGINLNIYDAYIASCTIEKHYKNLTVDFNNDAYSMRSTNGTEWVYDNNKTLTQIINSHDWDIVTFQQASAYIGRPSSYANLSNLVSEVRNLTGSHPKYYWYQTWAYDHDYMDAEDYFAYFDNDQETMFDAIIDCYENQVKPLGLFEKTIFAGTAVQNMRTSYMQDTVSRDGKHMSLAHGRYLLSLNFISNLLSIDFDLSPCSYIDPEINSSYKAVAYESIRNARNNPLQITQSAYTSTEMSQYDLTNYTEIDAELVGNAFYNSTDESNYSKRQGNVSGTSNKYVASKRFTSETLPTGSIVFCKEGFGFRPEAWVDDAQQSTRPSEYNGNVYEITDAFWTGYQYRAFNIYKSGKGTLLGQFNQVFDAFHIFVPNDKLGDLKTKTQNDKASEDRALFTGQYLKFDSYERIHLDPIIGFYKCDSYNDLTNSYVDNTAQKFVCTRPFYNVDGDLPENTVIIVDSGYQWRSDCWTSYGKCTRPNNVSQQFTRLDSSFMDNYRVRTFNVSSTANYLVGQNEIAFINHMRIYIPTSDDIEIERPDKTKFITFTALGSVSLTGMAASMLGDSVPLMITVTGDSNTSVSVLVNGSDVGATSYLYNKNTKALSIETNGSVYGYTYGTITGSFDPDTGIYSGVSIDGSMNQFVSNNGSISLSEKYHDRFTYTTEAQSNAVWQRWYGYSFDKNTGNGGWTTPTTTYGLETDSSMGLRIANTNYRKTRFTLKSDLNNGNGLDINGISLWMYNPNGAIYSIFRIYIYTAASIDDNGIAVPNGNSYEQAIGKEDVEYLNRDGWFNIQVGCTCKAYNISIYFETYNEATTYVYLGHLSLY